MEKSPKLWLIRKHMNTKIGYAYVVADILHTGHIRYLTNVKTLCDKLIVGVLTDEATMEKKPKPSIPFEQRFETIATLKCVDAVVTQDTYSPLGNVRMLRPNVLFESSSHSPEDLDRADHVTKELGIRLIIFPYFAGHSSTKIKYTIKNDS